MIKFENTEVLGWEHAIRGMRNPMNSWDKIDSNWGYTCKEGYTSCAQIGCAEEGYAYDLGPNDKDLMRRLRNAGTDHRKFMRMITVYVDITAPLYWWKEFDTYKVGTVANSCSTMHKIAAKEFTIDDFSCEHLNCNNKAFLYSLIDILNEAREEYNLDAGKVKSPWWQMIQLLPSSYNQRRTVMLNYEVLANMHKSRKNHKLDEWRELCEWIKTLPYHELITDPTPKVESQVEYTPQPHVPVTVCQLCNENGCGDVVKENCEKCQFYRFSKWAKLHEKIYANKHYGGVEE